MRAHIGRLAVGIGQSGRIPCGRKGAGWQPIAVVYTRPTDALAGYPFIDWQLPWSK